MGKLLTLLRIFGQPKKWRRRRKKLSLPSFRSLFGEAHQPTYRKRIG
jgi:hypothetical protein